MLPRTDLESDEDDAKGSITPKAKLTYVGSEETFCPFTYSCSDIPCPPYSTKSNRHLNSFYIITPIYPHLLPTCPRWFVRFFPYTFHPLAKPGLSEIFSFSLDNLIPVPPSRGVCRRRRGYMIPQSQRFPAKINDFISFLVLGHKVNSPIRGARGKETRLGNGS